MEQRLFSIVRRWLWLVVLATIATGSITYLIARRQPPVYEATTRLIVGPGIEALNPSSSDLTTGGKLMQTYAELAATRPILQEVIEKLGLNMTPEEINRNLVVRPTAETQFLTITVQNGDSQIAADIANTLAQSLVLRSPTGDSESNIAIVRDQMREQTEKVQENITNIESGIAQLETQLSNTSNIEGQRLINEQLALERERLSNTHATLALLLESLQQTETNKVRIVENAIIGEPIASQLQLQVLMGLMAGLILSSVIAITIEFLDDFTVKTAAQVSDLVKLQTLAGIGQIDAGEKKLVTVEDPRSPDSEAFRSLRTSIQFSSLDKSVKSLLITSSVPEEGRSTIAANLATVMAQAAHNVLLIDADLRRPAQHQLFELPNARGLTSLLLEFDDSMVEEDAQKLLSEVVQTTRVRGLQLLTSGPIPPNPSELLGSKKMQILLDALSEQYDFIIMDSPAVLFATDATVLGINADATLMVAWSGKSRKAHLQQAAELLREVKVNVMGCVLNGHSQTNTGMYSYYREGDQTLGRSTRKFRNSKQVFDIGRAKSFLETAFKR